MMNKEIEKLTQDIESNPKSPDAYIARGVAYGKKREWDNAIANFDKAIELDPKSFGAYFKRGAAYGKKREWDNAIADFSEAIELDPKNLYAHLNRGVAYVQKGELDNAIADFDKAIKLNPEHSDAYFNRGRVYVQKGELDKAIEDCDKAIEINPRNWIAYSIRGLAYAQKGELDDSIADFDKAIELNPKIPYVYLYLGLSYAEKWEFDNAIANFDKALELDSKYMYAYHARGIAYLGKKEWDEAIAEFNKAIKLGSKDPNAYSNRGRAYLMKENYEESFEDFVRADKLNPTLKFTHIYIYVASRLDDAICSIPDDDKSKMFENYLKLAMLMGDIQSKLFYKPKKTDVAHYTSLDTLKTLVNKTPFRLYNSTYMNDPEEGNIFFDVMKNVMKKLPGKSRINLKDMFYGKTKDKSYRSPAYIGSFVELDGSKKKDKLFLWRTYGKHNSEDAAGGCLVFPRANFAETYLPQIGAMSQHIRKSTDLEGAQRSGLEEKQNIKPPIYEIAYIENEKPPQELNKELPELAECLIKIKKIIKETAGKDTKDKLKQLARELLDGIRFLFKASHYKEENEVRAIQFRYHDENEIKGADKIKVDVDKIPPRFCVETPDSFQCNEVILGPRTRNSQEWNRWIKEQKPDLKVSKSKIKYGNPRFY